MLSSDTFVDFDHSLSLAVMNLRDALGDSSDTPLYIETIPKRGYRFIAPVTSLSLAPDESPIPHRWWKLTAAPLLIGAVWRVVGGLSLAYIGTYAPRSACTAWRAAQNAAEGACDLGGRKLSRDFNVALNKLSQIVHIL